MRSPIFRWLATQEWSDYAKRIFYLFEPQIGELFSKFAVEAGCKHLNIKPIQLDARHLPDIAKRLSTTASIYKQMGSAEDMERYIIACSNDKTYDEVLREIEAKKRFK